MACPNCQRTGKRGLYICKNCGAKACAGTNMLGGTDDSKGCLQTMRGGTCTNGKKHDFKYEREIS